MDKDREEMDRERLKKQVSRFEKKHDLSKVAEILAAMRALMLERYKWSVRGSNPAYGRTSQGAIEQFTVCASRPASGSASVRANRQSYDRTSVLTSGRASVPLSDRTSVCMQV